LAQGLAGLSSALRPRIKVGQALAGLAVDQILTKCAAFFPVQGESTAHLVIRHGRALHASRMLSLSKSSASIVLLSRWQDPKRLLVILGIDIRTMLNQQL
jgi:hypothetical protein